MARSDDWLSTLVPAAIVVVGLGVAVCGGFVVSVGVATGGLDRLERWWNAPPPWAPRFAVDPATTGGIDHATLHEKLLPAWVIAGDRRGSPEGDARYADACAAIRAAIAPDPNLGGLFDTLDHGVTAGPANDPAALIDASAAWSRYLADRGVPWRVHGTVRSYGENGSFALKTYHVLAAIDVAVDDADTGPGTARAEIVTRTDGLNVVEGYLGAVSDADDGARVIVDRVETFAIDTLWPQLDGIDAHPLAPRVNAEVAAVLPADTLARLRTTAPARRQVVAAVQAIRERRRCGNQMVVQVIPWDGFADEDFTDIVAHDLGDPCPGVTPEEAEAIHAGSATLRETPGLHDAIEALVAFATRPTLVHEARHVLDGGVEGHLACALGCADLSDATRAELSAYLASFASDGVAATALLQACEVRDQGGAHGRALALVRAIPGACLLGEVDVAASRDDELRYFGRRATLTLPADYPRTLPLASPSSP